MACGGCAAKVGADSLDTALSRLAAPAKDDAVLIGLDDADDAAAFRTPSGDVVLTTVDGFPAFTDDAHLMGRVAAENALSDVYAKGGAPRHAMALVTVIDGRGARTTDELHQVMTGLRRTLDEAGVSLLGGHSTVGSELFVGLSILGQFDSERAPLLARQLRPGDHLVLTKPLGTGVVLAADMRGLAPGDWWAACITNMLRSNRAASELALAHDVAAATDVSGFGLLTHLGEMLDASGMDARLDPERLPALPGALQLLASGIESTMQPANRASARRLSGGTDLADSPREALLFDPQTSGGLLIGVAAGDADALTRALRLAGDVEAVEIGRVVGRGNGRVALGPID